MENQLVTLLQITTPQLGSFVKDKLESEEIEVFFTNEGLTAGSEYEPNEILLKVKAGQSLKAVKILLDLHKDYDLNKVKDDASFKDLKSIGDFSGKEGESVLFYGASLTDSAVAAKRILFVGWSHF